MKLNRIAIQQKLQLIMLLTSGTVLLLASLAFVGNDIMEFRRTTIRESLVLVDLIGFNSINGLLFKDTEAVKMNLTLLKANPNIVFARIYNRDGMLFSSHFPRDSVELKTAGNTFAVLGKTPLIRHAGLPDATQPPALPAAGIHRFSDRYMDVAKPIVYKGDVLGAAYMRIDLTEFRQRLYRSGYIVLMTLLISLVLAWLLAFYFQRLITRPIMHLLHNMQQVGEAKDYSIRARKTTEDELGDLADGFNHMLMEIEKSHRSLREYRDHLEDMVGQRTVELAESRDQALAANLAKSTFLANMSHELRTPLNGILGYAQILTRDAQLNDKQREGVQVIQRSGNYLLTLINDILDLSKIEAGRIELYPMDFSFQEFIHSITDLFYLRAQQKAIGFICETPPNPPFAPGGERPLPAALHTDEKRLRQILINLLGNAVKFTKEGEVRLKIGYDGEQIRFQVEDTGPGIAEDEIDQIFQPFRQVGDVMHKAEGTGLGLSISKKLVEMMGGSLDVHSTLGQGSCFSFALVLPEAYDSTVTVKTVRPYIIGYQRKNHAPPYRILVVDDKIENRLVLVNMLTPLGFEMEEADDGTTGLATACRQPPHLVLMDLVMPEMDGLECIRRMREQPELKDIPIVVASASAFDTDRQRSFEVGATDFLPKPIEFDPLLDCLQKNLDLTWCTETPPQSSEEPPADAGSLIGPSSAQAEKLLDLAMQGDIAGINSYMERLAQNDPALRPFAAKVQALAKDFDEDGICELAEGCLNN